MTTEPERDDEMLKLLYEAYQEAWWGELEDRRRMLELMLAGKTVTITVSDVGIKGDIGG